MPPYYNERQSKHNPMYTVDHTFIYHSKKFVGACAKSSALAHGSKIRGRNLKLLETTVKLEGSPLICKVTYGSQTAIQGQGRFTKHGFLWPIPPVM